MTRFRITVRGNGVELRGYVDRDTLHEVARLFADDIADENVAIMVSPATDDYDPFAAGIGSTFPLIQRQSDLLTATANALKGEPDELTLHDHADIPEVAANVVRMRDGYKSEYDLVQAQLSDPPEGWYLFGHHVDKPWVLLEFWGDHGGVPIWERPRTA